MLVCPHNGNILKKAYIIRKHDDFVRVSIGGVFVRTDFFILQARINARFSHYRVGVTASKKVGNAVVRNRCKRRLRALADLSIQDKAKNIDYVFIAKSGLNMADWSLLLISANSAMRKIKERLQHVNRKTF